MQLQTMNKMPTVCFMKIGFIVLPLFFRLGYADIYWMNTDIKTNASIVGWQQFRCSTISRCKIFFKKKARWAKNNNNKKNLLVSLPTLSCFYELNRCDCLSSFTTFIWKGGKPGTCTMLCLWRPPTAGLTTDGH